MEELYYEPETKNSPVCAFRIQQGQNTDDVRGPSYQMLNVTVVKTHYFICKNKN